MPSMPAANATPPIDSNKVQALAQDIRSRIEGEVRFDEGSRALYATDGSNYRQVPIGVVIPRTRKDIIETVAACRKYGVPLLSRGGGTSLAGQCCNVAVVMDMSKYYNRILDIDPAKKTARIQPGVVLDTLRHAAEKLGLTFGPDPSTHNHCTLGGMIGNNSCGVHALMAGKTEENVHSLDILTYDGLEMTVGPTDEQELERIIREGGRKGEIYRTMKKIRDRYAQLIRERYPDIPRRVSGYNLNELLPENGFHVARALVGTESTCVVVLEATVRLVDNPKERTLVVLGYPDVYASADHVPDILKFSPIGLEGIDEKLVKNMRTKHLRTQNLHFLPEGRGWLLVEFGGDTKKESDAKGSAMMAKLKAQPNAPTMKLFDNKDQEEALWKVRESGLGATAFVPGRHDAWSGWEDSAVDPAQLGDYLREFRQVLNKYHLDAALYGHFGQGCLHCRITFDLLTAEGIRNYRSFIEEAADLVVKHKGSFSGEHGDGQSRAELLPKMYGPELVEAFGIFKAAWDPDNKMNPGKIVHPNKMTEDLRLGTDYNPLHVKTHFQFPEDQGSFARAALRCVGVGECRRSEGGTMCPSYMATKEEMHSTRGRTHLLFEMLQGQVIQKGWKDDHVREALDLCLACKGCKKDCPVNVDMATYKAEFLSHYYEGRLRPLHAYAFGLINKWSKLATRFPGLVNWVNHFGPTSALLKAIIGIAPQRDIPAYAPQNFRDWFATHPVRSSSRPEVLLWPDTFNNYFHPRIAKAAVEVLEDAGYRVSLPPQPLCCGRPLYDYGMLDEAKSYLNGILETLRPQIRAGIPIVGLEPSCMSVFREELPNLMPHDFDAKRLHQQSFLLSEFLHEKAPHYTPPVLHRKAILHGHCHQKSVLHFQAEEELLKMMELDLEVLDAGCCGMAGAFGFEKEHYDVSMACGERALLPAVRSADPSTLFITSGFSCHEQVIQATGRKALHFAEVLKLGIDERRRSSAQPFKKPPTPDEARPNLDKAAEVSTI